MSKNLVMVFTRNPELGKVKTRLAKTIGEQSALNIYNFLLNHTETVIRNIDCDKAIYYSVKVRDNDIWDPSLYSKHLQQGKDLGKRMYYAFLDAFSEGYKKVVIVGSDLYDLQPKHIENAFRKLDSYEVVIGPSEDGGYYLLGMKTIHSQVFTTKEWGTSTVFENTINDLQNESVFLLEELNDIDVYVDIMDIEELKQLIVK